MGCSKDPADYDPTLIPDNDPSDRIVGFGDSLTQGSVYSTGHYTYLYRVSDAVGLRVVNAGKGGSLINQDGQIGRIKRMTYRPTDTVLWLSGFNDMRLYGSSGVNQYKATLTEALNHMSPQVSVIYLGTCLKLPNYTTVSGWSQGSDQAAEDYKQTVIDVASNYPNVVVVDTTSSFSLSSSQFYDTVHPTMDGVFTIADTFISEL